MPAAAVFQRKTRAVRAHPVHAKSDSRVKITQSAVSITPIVQARLHIGTPNERFEQQANRVTEGVMRMGEPGHRMAPGPGVSHTPFASTAGRDVVSGSGCYSPFIDPQEKLLAHELTHFVQQGGASIRSGTVLPAGPGLRHPPLEHLAKAPGGIVPSLSMARSDQFLQRAVTEQGTEKIGLPTPKDQRCAGWFADHESLSKRAAEHYVQTELTGNRGKGEKIDCDLFFPASGVFACTVQFTEGTRIRVLVRKDAIIVGVDPIKSLRPPPDQPLCWYDYSCPGPQQDLVLTRRRCQTGKRASGSKP